MAVVKLRRDVAPPNTLSNIGYLPSFALIRKNKEINDILWIKQAFQLHTITLLSFFNFIDYN